MQSPARFTTVTLGNRHYVREAASGALTGPFPPADAQALAYKWSLISAACEAREANPQG